MAGWLRRVDYYLRGRRLTAIPIAVVKKFGDDSAANRAALIAYYGFAAIFPLLLVLSTVLGYVVDGDIALERRLLDSALADFPVIGPQLRAGGLSGHWYVIVASSLVSLWGARGVANAAQDAFNTVWGVPYARRPGFLPSLGRSVGLLTVAGAAVTVTGLLSGIGSSESAFGWTLRIGALCLSMVVSIAMFLLGFRLATASEIPLRHMLRSALVSAVVWQALLAVGTLILTHQVRHAQELYGTFGVVLGLLAWLQLQAQLTLYALEYDVVRVRRLWPRSLAPPPLTGGDKRAFRSYAVLTRRRPPEEQQIDVIFPESPSANILSDQGPMNG
jgi:uncharacterized BrkB/YihY/UPF0761 family membrane protein